MKLKSLLTTLAAVVGLTTAAQAYNNAWSLVAGDTAYMARTRIGSSGTRTDINAQYSNSRRGFAACVDIAEDATSTAFTIFNYEHNNSGNNTVQLSITASGTYNLLVRNGTTQKYSIDAGTVTAGRHIFEVLMCRCKSANSDQVIKVVVYLDGEELMSAGDGSEVFGGGPYEQIQVGTNGSANRVTVYTWTSAETDKDNARTYDAMMAGIVEDAATLFATYTATVSSDTNWSEIVWTPVVENPETANLVLTVENNAKVALDTTPVYGILKVNGTLTINTDSLVGEDLAKNAVCGAPYSYWFFPKAVTGTVKASTIPTVPNGYTITEQEVSGYGARFIVTAPAAAKFGAVSMNIHNGTALTGDGTHGLYPVALADWGNLKVANSGTETKDDLTFTLSSSVSGWGLNNTPPDMIQKQYMDDSTSTRSVTVSGMTAKGYEKYRAIVYFSTDTDSTTFSPMWTTVGDETTYYAGLASTTDTGATVKGKNTTWGHTGPNHNANDLGESVNALITDVLTADSVTFNFNKSIGGRATVAAIQIVKVGQAITTVDYAATISAEGEYNLSELDWSVTPFAPTDKDTVTITVDPAVEGDVTITVDKEDVVMSVFKIVSTDSSAVMVTGNAVTSSVIDGSASTGLVSINIDPGAAEVKAGTDTILYTIGTGRITIADGKKLTVTSGKLTSSLVSNNGTLNFAGGTAEDPISINGGSNLGKTTLAENTYVLNDDKGSNSKYEVVGSGATSVYKLARNGTGAPGMLTGSSFADVIIASAATGNQSMWLERATIPETVGLNVSGNITINAFSPTIRSLAGGATLWKYGTVALSIKCTEDADFKGTSDLAITILESSAVQTFSGNYTGTLTVNENATVLLTGSANPTLVVAGAVKVDPNGAALTLTEAITGAGNVIVHDYSENAEGSVLFSGDLSEFTGTITYENGSYDIGTSRTKPELPSCIVLESGVTFAAKQSAAEYALGLASEFTGFTEGQTIKFNKLDGTVEMLTVDAEGNATSTAEGVVHIDGAATYADATFTNATSATNSPYTGKLSYKSISGLGLQYDDTVTTNSAGTGAYLKHHPWITGLPNSFMQSEEMTIAVVGEMSPSNNTVFVHFGTTTGSSKGIYLASGSKEDEVVVKMNTGTALTDITTMTVPHAATARHVYIITKRDVDDESTVSVYLDGTPWKTAKFSKISLTGGVQCGSDHGGELHRANPPVVNAVSSDDTALINVLRVYDRVIDMAEIAAYSEAYPYVSASGTSSRTFSAATEDWIGAEAATCWSFKQTATSEAVLTNAPVGTSSVEIKGTENVTTTISLNLDADEHPDAVKISSPGALKFVKGIGTGQVISGKTTIGCSVEIEYGSLDISGAPLTLIDEGAIKFDLKGIDISTYFADATIPLTGDVEQNDAKITAKNLPESFGRTAMLSYNGTQYVLAITVEKCPFVYDEYGWSFAGGYVAAETVSNNTKVAICVQSDLEWNIDRDTFTVEEGTLKVTKVGTATITVEKGGTFDVNGLGGSVYTVILNGGKVINDGADIGDAKQVSTLTLASDSTIGGTHNFSVQGAADGLYSPTKINLESYTLTKTDTNRLALVNTTIEGTGMLYIKEGSIYSSENTTFTNGVLKIGAKGSLLNRGDKTLTISKIIGEEGALIWGDYSQGTGNFSDFTLEGTVTLQGGNYGTITMADGAVANVGTRRGLTFAGAGTVDVTLTDEQRKAQYATYTIFTRAEGATTTVGKVFDEEGNDITSKCIIKGNEVTVNNIPTLIIFK